MPGYTACTCNGRQVLYAAAHDGDGFEHRYIAGRCGQCKVCIWGNAVEGHQHAAVDGNSHHDCKHEASQARSAIRGCKHFSFSKFRPLQPVEENVFPPGWYCTRYVTNCGWA